MCEPRRLRRALPIAVAVLLATATLASAQDAPRTERADPADRAALLERIHRLEGAIPAADSAAEIADRAAALRRTGEAQDTVQVGPLHVVTAHSQAAEARVLWGQAWEDMAPMVGEVAERIDRESTSDTGPRMWFSYDRSPRMHEYFVTGPTRDVYLHTPVSDERVREAMRGAIGSVVSTALARALWQWGGIIPLGEPLSPDGLYRDFVYAPTELAQSCVQGSLQACWTAMGEMDPAADVVDVWYPPDDRRSLIAEVSPKWGGGERCLAHDDQVCRGMMLDRIEHGVWPFPPSVRSSLLRFAIQRGGPGALERLVESLEADRAPSEQPAGTSGAVHGPITHIREHLALAANMDPDVLIGLWRDQVLSGRPGSPAPDQPTRGNVFVWITLLGVCAAGSTRWRLG